MPNYNLVINSTFQPFTLERYLQPYMLYGQAFKENQQALADLNTRASVWENLANETTDPQTHAKYKSYVDDLKAQADTLAKQGMQANTVQNMLNLRSRFARDITPIETFYKKREEMQNQVRQMMAQDDSLIIHNDPFSMSLDSFWGNPNQSYEAVSGEKLKVRAAQLATAINKASSVADIKDLGSGYLDFMQRTGMTLDEFKKAMNSGNNEIVNMITNDVLNASRIKDWKNKDGKPDTKAIDTGTAWVRQGLYGLLGETQHNIQQDWIKKQEMEEAAAINLENLKHQHDMELQQAQYGGTPEDPFPMNDTDMTLSFSEDKNIRNEYDDAFNRLGLKENPKTGKVVWNNYREVGGTFDVRYDDQGMPVFNKVAGKKFRWVDNRNNIYTEAQFVNQGKTKEEKATLKTYYDQYIMPGVKKFGTRNMSEIYYRYGEHRSEKIKNIPNLKLTDKAVGSVLSSSSNVYSVDGYSNGHYITGSKANKNKTFYDKNGKLIEGIQIGLALDSDSTMQEPGLIIRTPKGGQYMVKASDFGKQFADKYSSLISSYKDAIQKRDNYTKGTSSYEYYDGVAKRWGHVMTGYVLDALTSYNEAGTNRLYGGRGSNSNSSYDNEQ